MAEITYALAQSGVYGQSNGVYQDALVTAIDQFNDSDFSEYSGETGDLSQETTTTIEGGSAMNFQTAGNSDFEHDVYSLSGDGLPNYFPKGKTVRCWVYVTSGAGDTGIMYGVGGSQDWFRAYLDPGSDAVTQYRKDDTDGNSQLSATNVTINTGTWYEIEVTWHDGSQSGFSDGDHTVDVFDTNGNSIDSNLPTTSNDTHHSTNDGVGMYTSGGSVADVYFDNYRIV